MERQYKYRVNRNIALNELVESTVSNRKLWFSPWSHDSDWDYYESLETDKIVQIAVDTACGKGYIRFTQTLRWYTT